MQSAFKDLSTFLSAWLIYISICMSFSAERGPGLASWTERLVFFSQAGYPWSTILGYAIAYYGEHQNSPPEAWFKVDGELIANHFGITTQKLITGSSSTVGPSKTGSSGPKGSLPSPGIPKQLQICLNYNHNRCANPCTARHRHVCAICANQHPTPQCPMTLKSSA